MFVRFFCIFAVMKSGIYKLRNIINNKIYLGSSINLVNRKRIHFGALSRGKHHSDILQKAYNKYGKDNFIFEILEHAVPERLIEREQHYINTLKPFYNVSPTAGSCLGKKQKPETKEKLRQLFLAGVTGRTGMKNSEEHKRKNREYWAKNPRKFSKKTRRKMRLARLGKPAWNKGTKGVMKAWNKGKKIWWGDKCTKNAHEALKKECYIYNLQGKLIKKFPQIRDLIKYLKAKNVTYYLNTFKVYRNKFILSTKKLNRDTIKEKAIKIKGRNITPVALIDDRNKIVRKFKSITKASEYYGIINTSICNNIKGLSKKTSVGKWIKV